MQLSVCVPMGRGLPTVDGENMDGAFPERNLQENIFPNSTFQVVTEPNGRPGKVPLATASCCADDPKARGEKNRMDREGTCEICFARSCSCRKHRE